MDGGNRDRPRVRGDRPPQRLGGAGPGDRGVGSRQVQDVRPVPGGDAPDPRAERPVGLRLRVRVHLARHALGGARPDRHLGHRLLRPLLPRVRRRDRGPERGPLALSAALWLLGAYLVGAVPVGYLVARILGVDVRRRGSRSIGATNVLRTAGWTPALVTLGGDIAKGYVAVWVGSHAGPGPAWAGAAAVLAVVGNCWPVFLGFRGGKGVATALGAFLRITPWALVPAAVVFASLVGSFRFVSLASLCAAIGLPPAIFALGYPAALALAGLAVAIIVIARHHQNIQRLLTGTENRFGAPRPGSGSGGVAAGSSKAR